MPYSTAPMEQLSHKSLLTTPHNLVYSYYLSPNFNQNLKKDVPTLMFLHGYPDDAYMWAGTLPTFLNLPYPFLCLDLLGFGDSSKPSDKKYYNYKIQADAIAQILDTEKVPNNVIPIGHDWGSATSQRFYLYHPARCVGLCINSLAYQLPSPSPFDLVQANAATGQRFGYPQWEYWNFFTDPEAPNDMRRNIRRFYEVMHGNYPSPVPEEKGRDIWMREMFCVPGAMGEYVRRQGRYKDYTVPLKPYAEDPELFRRFQERLCRDGLEGPVNYYHSLKDNVALEDEKKLCQGDTAKIKVPVLYIGQTGDWVCRTDLMSDAKEAGLVDDVEEKIVEAGHWVFYEKPEEMASLMKDWLGRRFPVKA